MSHVPSLIRPLGAALILGASAWGGQALAIPPAPIPDGPYISEVMANTASGQSATDEYIELWNPGPLPVSVEGMRFTDGDSTDTIVPWSMAATGVPAPGMVLDSWIIEPGEGAVILDPDYTTGTKPYAFAHGTVILTVTNASLGNGLSADDPITLYGPGGTTTADVLDTYGTPVGADVPGDRDDDGLDGLPLDPAAGLSAQRLLLPGADEDGNWWVGPPSPGYRPGSGEFHVAQDESQEYTTIYDALGSAGPGATLFVHPGTYSDNLKIYIPIRLVAVEGAEVTKITGTVTVDGAPDTTTIEGFTHTRQITALDTNLNLRECHLTGAAAFFTQAGGEISRCTFEGGAFGAHLEQGSSPSIVDSVFRNTTNAAIYAYYASSPTISRCTFEGAQGFGVEATSEPTIEDSTFSGFDTAISLGTGGGVVAHNTVTGCRGPALRINNNANAWVHANTLLDNSAGMELTYSASWLTDNVVGRSGGHGISIVGGYNFLEDDVFPQVRGNTVVESDEDGVYLEFADVTLWSNILAFNGRYGVNDATSRVLIGANALYGNSSGGYQSGLEGDEDVLSDPRFVDMDAADYQLTSASPCIDRGYDRDDHTDGLDAAGNPRQVDGNGDGIAHADIGALEYAPVCPDADGDGFLDANCGGEDCDDLDASTYPEAMELPDGVDNDCDGQVDEDDACTGGCCGAGRITAPAAGGRASAAAPWWLGVSLLLGASAVLRRRR